MSFDFEGVLRFPAKRVVLNELTVSAQSAGSDGRLEFDGASNMFRIYWEKNGVEKIKEDFPVAKIAQLTTNRVPNGTSYVIKLKDDENGAVREVRLGGMLERDKQRLHNLLLTRVGVIPAGSSVRNIVTSNPSGRGSKSTTDRMPNMSNSALEMEEMDATTVKNEDVTTIDPIKQPVSRVGVAPIKKEFLIDRIVTHTVSCLNGGKAAEGTGESKTKANNQEGERRTRGMNKNRVKEMSAAKKQADQNVVRLCKSVVVPGASCKYGNKCLALHSKEDYWARRSEDIGEKCTLFELTGECRFGIACRFAKAHTNAEDLSQTKKDPDASYAPALNDRFSHIQQRLRKRQYDFVKSDQIVQEYTPAKGEKNKDEKRRKAGESFVRQKPKLDMASLKGKRYLAPLTTVGNLPFRRLCVELGAEITCGEMAVATSLLQGTPSEWPLVRRHPSEKIFGVQLAGGYPDTMARTTQIIVDECEVDFVDLNLGCPLDLINDKGAGCTLANRSGYLEDVLRCMNAVSKDTPITTKMRYGLKEGERTAHTVMERIVQNGISQLITLHPRSKEQRYTKLAEWDYVEDCAKMINGKCPLWVCGDVLNYEEYYERLENFPIDGVMIGRGALIKPWIFTEIDERRHWDISATERLDIIKKYVDYGLENWGSDHVGVENTRRYLLEWLSFQCRYIPVGLLEVLPQRMNQRPPFYHGRSELETLLSSSASSDWVKITEMFLGPTPEGFLFLPKHNANAY